jgi:hypothetical protein
VNINPTYVQQWNLSWQQQVTTNWMTTVSYLGNKTTHLWLSTELDPAVYIPGTCGTAACSTTSNTNQRRVLYMQNHTQGAYYTTLDETDDGANANYNALLVSVDHRLSHNYSVLSNYTYSHCISDGEFVENIAAPTYEIQNDRNADRANCAYDHRHSWNTSVIANSPTFSSRELSMLAGGWQLSGIFTWGTTGGFDNVTTGKDNSLTGVGLDRPNVIGPLYPAKRTYTAWFNSASFQANALGTFGNAGRNPIEGPGEINLDAGLVRTFPMPFKETQNLVFRAEAFNIFNHTDLLSSGLHTSVTAPLFGTINAANTPRILQLALKYVF